MKVYEVWSSMTKEQRRDVAERCKTSVGHINNIAYGCSPCSPLLASRLESATGGLMARPDLRPDDWREIWPELNGAAVGLSAMRPPQSGQCAPRTAPAQSHFVHAESIGLRGPDLSGGADHGR